MQTTTPTVRAIVINPFTRTITETALVSIEGSTYTALRETIFPNKERPGFLERIRAGAGHDLYIDEEGVFVNWDEQRFFRIGPELVIAGIGVLVKEDAEGPADCTVPIDLVTLQVTWLNTKEVRIPAPYMTTMDENGNEKKTLLAGCEEYTYDNQP